MTDLNKKAGAEVLEHGCFTMGGFFSQEECSNIRNDISILVEKRNLLLTAEYDDVIVANHTENREVPGKLGDYTKPVIVTRGLNGFDRNMTEIFNVHRVIDIPVNRINEFVQSTAKHMGHSNVTTEFSVYINKGVKDIRGFHRDVQVNGSKVLYKLFVYLTDVNDYTYGPHSYIPGTHKIESCQAYANQLMGNYTDPNEYDFDLMPTVFTGQCGTMIMTTQSGMHRGLPQLNDKERIILVCKIRPS